MWYSTSVHDAGPTAQHELPERALQASRLFDALCHLIHSHPLVFSRPFLQCTRADFDYGSTYFIAASTDVKAALADILSTLLHRHFDTKNGHWAIDGDEADWLVSLSSY